MTEPVWVRLSVLPPPTGPGDAEVGDLHLALRRDQHVAGLDVAVDDAVAVGEVEGAGDVGGDVGRPVGVQRALGPQDLGQAAAPTYSMTMK